MLPDSTKQPGCDDFSLTLADGSRFILHGDDAQAARVVRAFANATALSPSASDAPGRKVLAVADGRLTLPCVPRADSALPLICPLPPPTDADTLALAMTWLTLDIAQYVQQRGGVLLHAALATWPYGNVPRGVLFVAPGSTGKSTATRRLPPPWRVLCDDTTLVVRDKRGQYWAHPVPTWSRFYAYNRARGGVWDTQSAVRLGAIFFLSQAATDRVELLESPTCAVALLAESAEQVGRAGRCPPYLSHQCSTHHERLANVEALAHAIPCWRLHLSLNGAFWNHVERAVADRTTGCCAERDATEPEVPCCERGAPSEHRFVVYTGQSMKPTLGDLEVLEILPTAGRLPRVGDVIYFLPPCRDHGVVHRVVGVTPQGIRTRGDHNATDDREVVSPDQVVGQVVAAYRGAARRAIQGGWRGRLEAMQARVASRLARLLVPLGRQPYHWLARATAALLPTRRQLRVVRFSGRGHDHHKLLWGPKLVGHYDPLRRQWVIRFPHRLLLDEARLPAPAPPVDRFVHPDTNRVTAPAAVAFGDTAH